MTHLSTPDAFFAGVRDVSKTLDQTQVDVVNSLVQQAGDAKWPIGWLAYGLATAWHEARFRPCDEIGHGRGHSYGLPGKYGQGQYGRGLVQLTWDRNYEWADNACGLNGALLKDFDLAKRPDIASRILIVGMSTGAFTGDVEKGVLRHGGHKLSDYITTIGSPAAFTAARHIINGTDRAAMIADYAVAFQKALSAGGYN